MNGAVTAKLLASVVVLLGSARAHAQAEWNFELAPYLWAASTDADVTLDTQTARVKRDFETVDLGGSLFGGGQIDRFLIWIQLDALALDTDELERAPAPGRLETDLFLATTALGWQFGGAGASTFDVLIGTRHLALDSKLTLTGIGRFAQEDDLTDLVIIVRPSWSLGERWRFNPTLSIGGGDSDLTWELQPQFQYLVTDNIALRVGYRSVHYKIDSHDRVDKWDGAVHGMIFGISGRFRL